LPSAQAETNFTTLINTLSHQLEMYKKADVKKKAGGHEDDDEVEKKKAEKEAEAAKKKVLCPTPPFPRVSPPRPITQQ